MKRLYEDEIAPRLNTLRPRMKVGSIGRFHNCGREYELPYVIAESHNPLAKQVFLSAGIHGDEVAGIFSLLDFLDQDACGYLDRYSFVALPCLNPSGFEGDERHNYLGLNINRDFICRSRTHEAQLVKMFMRRLNRRYVFCLNAHEDPTDRSTDGFTIEDNPTEFYLYLVSPSMRLGHTIMSRMRRRGYQVCRRERIYGDRAKSGIVWWAGSHDPEYRENDTLENHFLKYTSHSIAPETPTCWALEDRIDAHKLIIYTAIEYLKEF